MQLKFVLVNQTFKKMGLQVISWMRFYNEESIPVCQHDQNFRQTNSTEKLMNSLLNDEIDLEKCWKYFSNSYHFYCLPPNFIMAQ